MSTISSLSLSSHSTTLTPRSKNDDPEYEAAKALTTLLLDQLYQEGLTGATANKSASKGESMFRGMLAQHLAASSADVFGERLADEIIRDLRRGRGEKVFA